MKSSNFEAFLNNLTNELDNLTIGQVGGGLSVDVGEQIAGRPVYQSYVDCAPPAIIGSQLVSSQGCKPMCGGKDKKKKRNRRRKSAKATGNRKKTVKRSRNRKRKSRKVKAKKSKTTVAYQSGGLSPGEYPIKGDNSNFNGNMNNRNFDCKQPTWKPSCI